MLDPEPGDCAWSRAFGDADNQQFQTLAPQAGGGVVVAGTFDGTVNLDGTAWASGVAVDVGAGNSGGVFVAGLGVHGGVDWSVAFGPPGAVFSPHAATDAKGNVHVLLDLAAPVELAPGVVFDPGPTGDGLLVTLDSNGGYVRHRLGRQLFNGPTQGNWGFAVDVNGAAWILAFQGDALVLVRVDEAGNQSWRRELGACSGFVQVGRPLDVTANGDGILYLTPAGNDCALDLGGGPRRVVQGGRNAVVGVLRANGAHVWSRLLDAHAPEARDSFHMTGRAVLAGAGNSYVALQAQGTVDLGCGAVMGRDNQPAVFLAALDAHGACVWQKQLGPLTGVALDVFPDGAVLLASSFRGVVELGGMQLDGGGGALLSVVMGADGTLESARVHAPAAAAPMAVTVTAQGHYALAGNLHGRVQFCDHLLTGAGMDDVFVALMRR